MNGMQTFFVIGAMVLLGLLALNVNRFILSSSESTYLSEYMLAASNVAQMRLDEVEAKAFDEAVANGAVVTDPASFSALGADAGEANEDNYDDIDDYNNSLKAYSTPRAGIFNSRVVVNYVSLSNPDSIVSVKTRIKRITVKVFAPILKKDTLRMYYYSSY